jgi:hypothetical protein
VRDAWGWKLRRRWPKYPAVIARVETEALGTVKVENTVRLVLGSGVIAKGTLIA